MKFYIKDSSAIYRAASADEVLNGARSVLRRRYRRGRLIQKPKSAGPYLIGEIGHLDYECFAVLWLDANNRVIKFEPIFHGTIDGASVYPREVVRLALQHNAAGCILAHNHPSGETRPSTADEAITARLKTALALVDVKILDHLIVAADAYVSLAELGKV